MAGAIEPCAGFLIGLAAIQATVRSLWLFFAQTKPSPGTKEIRLTLGRWLALALEFELAANILRTAIAPTWNEIGQLAAIIVLRTALNFFLQREIDHAAGREKNDAGTYERGVAARLNPYIPKFTLTPKSPSKSQLGRRPWEVESKGGAAYLKILTVFMTHMQTRPRVLARQASTTPPSLGDGLISSLQTADRAWSLNAVTRSRMLHCNCGGWYETCSERH